MLSLLLIGLVAAQPAAPPAPTRWVTDQPALLSAATRDTLDRQLEEVERRTGHQVLVWIGTTTGGEPIEDFAERAFRVWRVGRAGLDDGVVLFVFPQDRAVRIEVGYGLEGVLPDAVASRIIREQIGPLLAAGKPDEAIRTGTATVLAAITSGSQGQAPAAAPTATRVSKTQLFATGAAILAFIVLFLVRPDLAMRLLALLWFFGRGGRSSGGGGGFSGGGGRSGGGGASGHY